MIPKPPPRDTSLGFLYIPPYRVQGMSIAGEATTVQIPELDIVFDLGACPRAVLPAKFAAISHGHMDHVGGLAYWCSQRYFQGMGPGKIVCDSRIAGDIKQMMSGFVSLERQRTPYELLPLTPGEDLEIKPNTLLRCFETEHTCPSVGYVIVEKRTKLKEEYMGLPQDKLTELKQRGVDIVRHLEIPLVAYMGDTLPGPHMLHESVRSARVIVTECTFFEAEHRDRAKTGMHLHIDDIAEWLKVATCEAMVLTHISRRTNLQFARNRLRELVGRDADRVHILMDHRTNRERYERQADEAERQARG